jgi:Type I phosphodiesterase / nucleotide pyrophosphatase
MLVSASAAPRVERVVVLKVDGLTPSALQDYVRRTRGSRAPRPWLEYVFERHGVWLDNFYARGLSLSAPSWSVLDTGRHLEIRGNAEYDRYTLRAYDYLNFFPSYVRIVGAPRDMPGVELLDEYGIPLLIDRFPSGSSFQGTQLLQRDVDWSVAQTALKRTFSAGGVREFIDEWQLGWAFRQSWDRENEERLVAGLKDSTVRYLEFFTGEFDHLAHLTNDPVSQRRAVEAVDTLVGRVWNAIQESPLADSTALVLVSDHGMNTSPSVISQGYSLVDWFTSRAGGAQPVITNRHPMEEFKIRGLDVFVDRVVTASPESSYLSTSGEQYPIVALDLDGNERAGIGLRSNTFNRLHVLLDQLTRRSLTVPLRAAATTAFFETLNAVRATWREDVVALTAELAKLTDRISIHERLLSGQPETQGKKGTRRPLSREEIREERQVTLWRDERAQYSQYIATLRRLLELTPAAFDPFKLKITDLVPPHSLGPPNSVWDIQHYVAGIGSDGLVLASDGRLDWGRSFRIINYLSALTEISVRNNVQADVGPRPVDFIAVRIPDGDRHEALWLYRDDEHQALIQARSGRVRYQPAASLESRRDGSIRYERRAWAEGFPLEMFEDPQLTIATPERAAWLDQWHSEREWLQAVHKTRYSNGIIGLTEALLDRSPLDDPYLERKRRLRRPDLLVLARNHWNFNARGFNPGGNHGSFFRPSTHSVLLITGGKATGIPQGLHIDTPYDGLSFAPTILALTGRPDDDLPGPIIEELFPANR